MQDSELARSFEHARSAITRRHHELVQMRDKMHVQKRRHLRTGEIAAALDAEQIAQRLDAELTGHIGGSVHVDMLRQRFEDAQLVPVSELAAAVERGSASDQCAAIYELLGRYGVTVA